MHIVQCNLSKVLMEQGTRLKIMDQEVIGWIHCYSGEHYILCLSLLQRGSALFLKYYVVYWQTKVALHYRAKENKNIWVFAHPFLFNVQWGITSSLCYRLVWCTSVIVLVTNIFQQGVKAVKCCFTRHVANGVSLLAWHNIEHMFHSWWL